MKSTTNLGAKKSLIAVSIALLLPISAQSQTLEHVVAHTLDTNPELRIAFNRFKAKEEQVNQAFAGFLPSLDVSAGYGIENTDSPSTRRTRGRDNGDIELKRGEAGISIRQMLFDGFYSFSELDRTEYEASAEQWALYSAAEDMALEVSKVYLNYLRNEQVLTLAEKNLLTHQNIYDQIKQRTDSGLGSTADLSQISGRLARANANVISARNNFYDAKAQFIKVTEVTPDGLIIPVPDADLLPETFAEVSILAKENHPILKSAAVDIKAAESQRESSQSNYYPTISLELDGNWNNNLDGENGTSLGSAQVGGYNNDLVAMVRMRYNLFDGGRDLAKDKEAAYKVNESKEVQQRAYRQVIEGANLAWNAYESLGPQKNYIKQHVIAAKETQSAYTQQFNLGQRTLLDLLDTENELFEARKDYLQAEYDQVIAQYRVLNATGQLLNALRVTRPLEWMGEDNYEGGVN
ncbi:TolC family outer membrane protein [Shewanella sp. NIFS-20-20]|uniref:TolC family outer membrane protein n=1 Tax=Shewanella sp. NIFS-20-20 TaxID=2853806 RepID=UPI001C453805|nr:TolC family outer membrane protein [Shewanella sp. NIFS-20-20]MBV7317155.1 TolC family outer membrane protein [Shewanella sp. NIFS-20-20]